MIQVTIATATNVSKIPFPKLMQRKDNGEILLMKDKYYGTYITARWAGVSTSELSDDLLRDYDGVVTIQNQTL